MLATTPVAPAAPALTWERHAFAMPDVVWSVAAIDTDADGTLELVAICPSQVFAVHLESGRRELLADVREPQMLYGTAIDADGDGDQDLAIGRYRSPWIGHRRKIAAGENAEEPKGPDFTVAWIENRGIAGGDWPVHAIDREFHGIHGLCTADIDGDGIPELFADSIDGPDFANSLGMFRRSAGASRFQRTIVSQGGTDGRPHYLDVADIDGDGRGDLLLGDSGGGTFTWWKPTEEGPWKKHLIAREAGATNIHGADLDGDGAMDVAGSCGHGRGIFWFEGPGWEKHEVDPDLSDVHALAVGDWDADGDTDIAAASFSERRVHWYANDGKGSFTRHEIDTGNDQQSYDLKTVDLDRDGRPDLVLAGRESRNVVWYRNLPEN